MAFLHRLALFWQPNILASAFVPLFKAIAHLWTALRSGCSTLLDIAFFLMANSVSIAIAVAAIALCLVCIDQIINHTFDKQNMADVTVKFVFLSAAVLFILQALAIAYVS